MGPSWQRVDGVRITDTAAELVGTAAVAIWDSFIARTAGGAVTNDRIWFGAATEHCSNWTSSAANGVFGASHSAIR